MSTGSNEVEQSESGIVEELMQQLQSAQDEISHFQTHDQLSFRTPISILSLKPLIITGVLLAPGKWKGKIYTADQIAKAPSAKGTFGDVQHAEDPVYKDKVIGKIISDEWNALVQARLFRAEITDPQAQRDIMTKKFTAVSAKFYSQDVSKDGQVYAQDIKWGPNNETPKAWTLTDFPACDTCYIISVENALTKLYGVNRLDIPVPASIAGKDGYPYGGVDAESRMKSMEQAHNLMVNMIEMMMGMMGKAGMDTSSMAPMMEKVKGMIGTGATAPDIPVGPEGPQVPQKYEEVKTLSNQPGGDGQSNEPGTPVDRTQPISTPTSPVPTQTGVSKEEVEKLLTEKVKEVKTQYETEKAALVGRHEEEKRIADAKIKELEAKIAPAAPAPATLPTAASGTPLAAGTPPSTPPVVEGGVAKPPEKPPEGAGSGAGAPVTPTVPVVTTPPVDPKEGRRKARELIKAKMKEGKISSADLIVAIQQGKEEQVEED